MATAGYLLPWWLAMRDFIERQRLSGAMTPDDAGSVLLNYLTSCAESHRGSVLSGGYQSSRVEQSLQMIQAIPGSALGKVECRPFMAEQRKRVPASIRHDGDLVASSTFFALFEDVNRDFALNAGNLEIVVEMLVSSLAWLMGSHNGTFKWFFQVRPPLHPRHT